MLCSVARLMTGKIKNKIVNFFLNQSMQTDKSAKSLVYIKEEKGNIKTELVNSKNDSKRLVSLVILE